MKLHTLTVILACFLVVNCSDTKEGNTKELPLPVDAGGDSAEPPKDVEDAGETTTEDVAKDSAKPDTPPDASCGDEGACDEAGDTRCSTEGVAAIERCEENDAGCLVWTAAETCPKLNKCTGVADICDDGECKGPPDAPDPNASCDTPSNSCVQLKCDPADGICKELAIEDEASCDDDDVCTEGDFCFAGECQPGENTCPKDCQLDDLPCGESVVTTLKDDGKDTMDAYGCDGTSDGYAGAERVFKVQGGNQGCPGGAIVTVEFDHPGMVGAEYVDLLLISPDKGICYPSDCLETSVMDDSGITTLTLPDLEPGKDYFVVVDGRNGFEGTVRVSATCCGQNAEVCSNGVDDTQEGLADCDDPACQQSSGLCNFEYNCTDGIDNDDNGKTDCQDAKCEDSPDCNIELDCTDGADDDEDGKVDCEDSDCANDAACVASCTTPAKVLTCGDTLAGEAFADTDVVQLDSVVSCADSSEYGEGSYQRFYQVVPNCAGEYTIKIVPEGDDFLADAHFLDGSCSNDAGCAGTLAMWFGVPESVTLKTGAFPAVWGMIVNAFPSMGSVPGGAWGIEVTCECE